MAARRLSEAGRLELQERREQLVMELRLIEGELRSDEALRLQSQARPAGGVVRLRGRWRDWGWNSGAAVVLYRWVYRPAPRSPFSPKVAGNGCQAGKPAQPGLSPRFGGAFSCESPARCATNCGIVSVVAGQRLG
jgi:hypothetical protein